ncbi:MAG: transcription termination factor NusA, partial [Patescibacteria group bacterium]|nr:transcription termination factor NusA [Patescibacteria group bacterium]
DARLIKRDASLGSEIIFPLEPQEDFGRIAAQTAKQVVIQKVREAEKLSMMEEFGGKRGEIVGGIVQRMERGAIFVDLGRATGIIPYEEQIPGERYRPGERIRAYLYGVDEGFRGVNLRLSRAHPQFVVKLFEAEAPELAAGAIEVKGLVREPGSRTKIAVASVDPHVDPVGSLVGQRGVRVATVMSQLGGERIDIVDYSLDPREYIREALSPAEPASVEIDEAGHRATVTVAEDEQSLAIGRGGQNVRLAAKLTGWNIDIVSSKGAEVAESDGEAVVIPDEPAPVDPADPDAPAKEAGVDAGESEEVITSENGDETETPAEEELAENPESSETAAEAKDDRDPAKDEQ